MKPNLSIISLPQKKLLQIFLITFCVLFWNTINSQTLNQSANWPNTSWTLSGTYDNTALLNNPTTSANFSYDDDAAGSTSTDEIYVESPIIDLTAAQVAGENWINVNYDYDFNNGNFLELQYYDTDAAAWVFWEDMPDNSSSTTAWCSNITAPDITSSILDISSFTSTQLSGFKYRFAYDATGVWGWGVCVSSPTIFSTLTPTCVAPDSLTTNVISSTSVDLGWDENNSATEWEIEYGTTGFVSGTGTSIVVTSNPSNISGLSPNTVYDWYVRSICAVGDTSAWSSVSSFNTLCNAYTVPFTESFNSTSTTQTCWAVIDANSDGDSWDMDNTYAPYEGDEAASAYTDFNGGANDDYLISPTITLSNNQRLRYYVRARSGSEPNDYEVLISTAGTGLSSFTDTLLRDTLDVTSYQERIIDLSAYSGNVNVAFHIPQGGLDGYYLYIDSVTFEDIPSCLNVTSHTASSITPTSADLNWTDPNSATEWELEYGVAGFTQGTGTTVSVTTSPNTTLSGLTPTTNYDWYVRSICAVGDTSAWTSASFVTACPIYTPNYIEDFSSFVPSCWIEAGAGSPSTGPSSLGSGLWIADDFLNNSSNSGAARINLYTTSREDWIISPRFDLSSGGPFQLIVEAGITDYANSNPENMGSDDTVQVVISVDSGLTWTPIYTWDVNNQPSNSGSQHTINLTSYSTDNNIIGIWAKDGPVDDSEDYDFFIDNFEIRPIPLCLEPTQLSSMDNVNSLGTSVALSWTENNSATEWEIEYGTTGFTQGSGTIVNTTSNPDTLNGLLAQTTYDWYVRSVCNVADTSGWSLMGSFTTPCIAYVAPFLENFDTLAVVSPYTDLPICWEPQVGPDYWDITDDVTNTGHTYLPNIGDHTTGTSNYMWIDASSDITANAMITPFIDLSGLTTPYVGFWFASNNTTNSINHTIALDAWDGTAWVNIKTESGNFPTWVEVSSTLPSTIPSVTRFKIYAIANPIGTSTDYYYNDLGVDDFFVVEAPSCLAVDSILSSNPTNTSMDLNWIDPNSATEWQIEYGPTGFIPGTGSYVTVNSAPPYTLSGLTTYQTYDVYVRAVCTIGDSSAWAGPSTFTVGLPLAGNYTIDSTQAASATNFQSFTDFTNILGLVGVSANVFVDVVPSSGPYNQQVIFPTYNGASASSSVTINANGETVEYEPASSDKRIVGFDNTSYINIKNLKVVGLDPTYGFGIHFTNASHHISIDSSEVDLTLATSTTSTNVGGIISSGSVTSTTSTGNNASNISITNSKIDGGVSGMYYAVRFNGNSSSDLDSLIRFENNEVANFYAYGIYLNHIKNSYVGGNDVHRADKQSVTTFYGITTGGGSTNDTINANRIHNTHGSATSTTGSAYGIYNTSNDADAASPNIFVNNLIYDFNSASGVIYAIYNTGSDNQAYVNNTISLDHTSATAGTTRGFYQTTTASGILFANNNISITRGGSGTKHVLYFNTSTSTITSDYNNLYTNSTGSGSQYVGYENAVDHATLANWQTTTYDANSVSVDPLYLNVIGGDYTPAEPALNGAGFNFGVPVDFNGVSRNNPPDIGAYEFSPPSCLPPNSLVVNLTSLTSVDFDWVESGTATEWQIEYDTTGYTQGTGNSSIVTSKPVSLISLNGNTTYDFYVRAICGPGDSSIWVGPVSITTPCLVQAPYSESFDTLPLTSPYTDLPNCWEPQVGPDYWSVTDDVINTGHSYLPNIGDHTTGSSNYMWIDASADITANAMITPFIDVSGLTTPYVGFWFASDNTTNSINHTIALDAWDGTAWVNIATETGNFPTWVEVSSTLPSSIPSVTRFKIYAIANPSGTTANYYYNDLGVDDFFVVEAPLCPQPSNLASISTSTSSADISWTSSASNSIVEYGSAGFTLGTGTQIVSSSNTESITGLTPNLAYEVYVRDSCGLGINSTWVGPITFGSTAPCDDFDIYNTGDANSQSVLINSWAGAAEDAEISTDYASSGPNSLKIHDTGTNGFSDVVAELEDYSSGTWNMTVDVYIPATYGGYYNILHNYVGSGTNVWAIEVTLDANGTATVEEGTNGTATIGTFNYNPGAWNTIEHIIDLDNDTAYIIVNGVNTNVGWQFSLGSTNFGDQFNAMNFYSTAPTGQTPLTYFDNFCITPYVIPVILPYYPIGTINTVGANGVADSLNVQAWTSGTVAGVDIDGTAGLSFTIIDQSGSTVEGINVNSILGTSSYVVNEGDSILLRGRVGQSNGLQQFIPDSISIISTGHSLPIHMLTTTLNETTESQLIRMEDLIITNVGAGTSYEVTLSDGSNSFVMFVDEDTDVDNHTFAVGDNICYVNGIGGQFDNSSPYTSGYEIVPMRASDVAFTPTVDLGPDTLVCDTAMFMLDAGAGFATYSWNVGGSSQMLQPTSNDSMYVVTVTDSMGCTATDTIIVTVDICTGLDKYKNTLSFAIAPNPSKGIFNISANGLNKGETSITVRDISGKVIYSETVNVSSNNFKSQINLEGQAKGIYFISVTNIDQVIHNKVVIQ